MKKLIKSTLKNVLPNRAAEWLRVLRYAHKNQLPITRLMNGELALIEPIQETPIPELAPQEVEQTPEPSLPNVTSLYLCQDKRRTTPLSYARELCAVQRQYEQSFPDIWLYNIMYGLSYTLKLYAGFPFEYSLKAQVTHLLNGKAWEDEAEADSPVIFTSGRHLEKKYREAANKKVFAIGHPIKYAMNIYSDEEIIAEKKRLGRNALIFPSHCHPDFPSVHTVDFLLELAEKLKADYDSVRFCLHWGDIYYDKADDILNSGYECVTAGYGNDPFFLQRLKGLFSVADHTFANAFGSASFLSIGEGKPHVIYQQKIEYELIRPCHWKTQDELNRAQKRAKRIAALFGPEYKGMTSQQRQIAEYYCGFSLVKSREEIRSLFYLAEKLWNEQHGIN